MLVNNQLKIYNMAFIVATFTDVPNSDLKNFVVLGSYPTKEDAKIAVGSLASAVVEGTYKNVTIYKIDTDANKIYTFEKQDLQDAYEDQQKLQRELYAAESVESQTAPTKQPQQSHDSENPVNGKVVSTSTE